ncbi:MAG: prenyltransferase/squalene oxidase repeat-containing protein [Planctomycetales bacterium]
MPPVRSISHTATLLAPPRVLRAYTAVRDQLLALRDPSGHWSGALSTSALATATAVMALEMVRRGDSTTRAGGAGPTAGSDPPAEGDVGAEPASRLTPAARPEMIRRGLRWLAEHRNLDGGWGDTTKSVSNISTTMLARAVFHACGAEDEHRRVVDDAVRWLDRAGGVPAVVRRYGKDRTFSAPILTHCALAGLVDWKEVIPLPFELACLPPRFYSAVRLPVVSYALPALIAIGQVRHHHRPTRNPLARVARDLSKARSLRVLERIQPANGGFLEATPLTSFVTMSLAGMGLSSHPVARKGVEFLMNSVRPDGSWPIDTNLATWVTTLSVHALGDDLPEEARGPIRDWLLGQQYREPHPYTNAAPGGWAWTDLPGGVPDGDDTPGALLALMSLDSESLASGGRQPPGTFGGFGPQDDGDHRGADTPRSPSVRSALELGIHWLLNLQNRDGGWPTFCRGWGTLPFDRSAPDLTAHCLRAIQHWLSSAECGVRIAERGAGSAGRSVNSAFPTPHSALRATRAIARGYRYLARTQRPDGSWLPLWFGNQHAANDENPVYGTARVLAAYHDCGRTDCQSVREGLRWLVAAHNADGGWGGAKGIASTVEETALATDAVLALAPEHPAGWKGVEWLLKRVEAGTHGETSPIGFYFAKLWYFEGLYPLAFTTAALRRAATLAAAGEGVVSRRPVNAARGERSGRSRQ